MKKKGGQLPIAICATCKSIRNDAGHWEQLEAYLLTRYGIEFTHTLCPADLAADLAAADRDNAGVH